MKLDDIPRAEAHRNRIKELTALLSKLRANERITVGVGMGADITRVVVAGSYEQQLRNFLLHDVGQQIEAIKTELWDMGVVFDD